MTSSRRRRQKCSADIAFASAGAAALAGDQAGGTQPVGAPGRWVATTYFGSAAEALPARSTANLAHSPPPVSNAADPAAAVRLRRAASAVTPPPMVRYLAAVSIL